jgi:benzoyl-CoA reductase/2-hydroxyglutaryl-CoA dehydratase subunit BcrC/BadD/HgdB
MILDYFRNVAQGVEARLATDPGETVARKLLTLELARLGVRLFDGEHRVAWCGIATPYDLLAAMDVTPCFVEFVGATLASTGMAGGMIGAAEQSGFSTDSCAYHRAVLAADMAGMMPDPDFVVGTSCPCSGGLAVVEQIAAAHGRPLMAIHVPPDDQDASIAFLADQYRELARFVERRLEQPLDTDRLRSALELSNRTREAMVELFGVAGRSPTPARRRDMVNVGITLPLLFGTEAGLAVAEAYRDELSAKHGLGGREPLRLLWLQNRIQFRNPLADMLADDYGAHVVADELNDVWWGQVDVDDPFAGMARRTLSSPLMLSAQRRVDNIWRMVQRHDIDGVINPCHWGCRQGTGTRGLIQQGLREHGVPVLNLEVDCVDERNFSAGQLQTRLEAFVEMLQTRRSAGG